MTASMDIDFTRRNKKPRLLTDPEREKLEEYLDNIHYSSRYAPHLHPTLLHTRCSLSPMSDIC